MRGPVLSLLLLVAVSLAGCGGATASPSAPASPAASAPASAAPASAAPPSAAAAACADSADGGTVPVAIADFAFDPDPVEAAVGDVIAWTNEDSAPHSAVLADGSCGTDTLQTGMTGALVFSAAGTYPYVCGIHPAMQGTIEVR